MAIADTLHNFQESVRQVDSLIANAHRTSSTGTYLFPEIDREQITVAGFLNLFIAWESFLEGSLAEFMTGAITISGAAPVRYVLPQSIDAARAMVVGVHRYFDYANTDNVRKITSQYFRNGYPYEPHISAVSIDLQDLRTMRNASAHISAGTQTALESLAQRLLRTPQPRIKLYSLLTSRIPSSVNGDTVLSEYKEKLLVVAGLIAQG